MLSVIRLMLTLREHVLTRVLCSLALHHSAQQTHTYFHKSTGCYTPSISTPAVRRQNRCWFQM